MSSRKLFLTIFSVVLFISSAIIFGITLLRLKDSEPVNSSPRATENLPTATSGSFTVLEGKTTYDCTNPSSITRYILNTISPIGATAYLKVTSYVDIYEPRIEERTIFEGLVHDGETIAATMNETPPSGFGNVHFAITMYFQDGSYITGGSDANVGWPHDCGPTATPFPSLTPTSRPSPTPTLRPTSTPSPRATSTPIPTGTPLPSATQTTAPPAACLNVVVYATNGTIIPSFSSLHPGDTVVFAMRGTPNTEKVRFRINGGNWIETAQKTPQGEFAAQYTIPSSATSLTFEAQAYTTAYGWQ